MHIHMFPQPLLDLLDEIHRHHPSVVFRCWNQQDPDFYVQLGEVAGHCGMVLDGNYTKADVLELCTVITKKLVSMRTLVIVPDSVDLEDRKKIVADGSDNVH